MHKYIEKSNNNNVLRFNFMLREGSKVSRHKGIMSESLKEEIAKELGVYNTVASEGWGSVSSKNCGNMVAKAIEMAGRNLTAK